MPAMMYLRKKAILLASLLVAAGLSIAAGLVSARSLTLAAEDDFYPFSAVRDGELVGFVPALTRAAFNAVGTEVQFQTGPFSRVLYLVESGRLIGGFTGAIDDSNRSAFHWHKTPIGTVQLAIWARTGEAGKGLGVEDLEGQDVSVTRGFFNTDEVDQNPRINRIVAPSDESSLKMLALGRSDFALVTDKIGQTILRGKAESAAERKVEIVGFIDEVDLYVFFSKTHPKGKAAAELFQRGLEAIISNGTYERLARQWLPDPAPVASE
ncbi:hypothetical protein soil367_14795 [Hydrocarboniclastica marina]|uniref:Solute-binding protein family 3/N-terminal domain-containing protein n=2 Tax=Hydrocarboniclastica marina TaxID=2259620 RepID=A0A4P7XJ13_9ALTE|nr:hypothetical protein soil367_14795 [Hydrocarboniclastica marina]